VGIDGVDCSGKTILAGELAKELCAREQNPIQASIDNFHNPRELRYQRGRTSPQGYYEDSFNLPSLLSDLLHPLGPEGDRRYTLARFDLSGEAEIEPLWERASPDAILLFEGVFLHRPELLPHWDFSLFLDVAFEVTIERASKRDLKYFGSEEALRSLYRQRYIPGQQLYLEAEQPAEKAGGVLDNNNLVKPILFLREASPWTAQKRDLADA